MPAWTMATVQANKTGFLSQTPIVCDVVVDDE